MWSAAVRQPSGCVRARARNSFFPREGRDVAPALQMPEEALPLPGWTWTLDGGLSLTIRSFRFDRLFFCDNETAKAGRWRTGDHDVPKGDGRLVEAHRTSTGGHADDACMAWTGVVETIPLCLLLEVKTEEAHQTNSTCRTGGGMPLVEDRAWCKCPPLTGSDEGAHPGQHGLCNPHSSRPQRQQRHLDSRSRRVARLSPFVALIIQCVHIHQEIDIGNHQHRIARCSVHALTAQQVEVTEHKMGHGSDNSPKSPLPSRVRG
ncbi:hypothetical protein QBC39DRAFT_95381 [Podospora conica]|nr:hypothetical protein QBC39DRAFT_95381 [Schizothecium conicum]